MKEMNDREPTTPEEKARNTQAQMAMYDLIFQTMLSMVRDFTEREGMAPEYAVDLVTGKFRGALMATVAKGLLHKEPRVMASVAECDCPKCRGRRGEA